MIVKEISYEVDTCINSGITFLIKILEYEIKDNSFIVTDDAKRCFDEDGCIIVRYSTRNSTKFIRLLSILVKDSRCYI